MVVGFVSRKDLMKCCWQSVVKTSKQQQNYCYENF